MPSRYKGQRGGSSASLSVRQAEVSASGGRAGRGRAPLAREIADMHEADLLPFPLRALQGPYGDG